MADLRTREEQERYGSTVTRVWRKRLVRTRLYTKVRTSSILRRILIGARVQSGEVPVGERGRRAEERRRLPLTIDIIKTTCPPPSSVIFAEKSSGKFFPASALCHVS